MGIKLENTVGVSFVSVFWLKCWQVNAIGPQISFPVREYMPPYQEQPIDKLVAQGILNYNGRNTVAISLWATDSAGAKLDSLSLELTAKIHSSMPNIANQPMPEWTRRQGAY